MISDELLQEIEGEICANRRVMRRELHHTISEVSKTTIHEAVTEKLGRRKFCAHLVPKMVTGDHKTKRMVSELKFLTRYAQEGDDFLDSILTGDETWVFHHTPESKQQSLQWRHTHSKDRRQISMTWGYRSCFQDLVNVWTTPANMLKNKVM